MNAVDFSYDGLLLSDFKFIICDFNGSSGIETVSAGSKITFNKVSKNRGKSYTLTSTQYEECYTTTFDICKDPDYFPTQQERYITADEYRDIMRWLNRHEFLEFEIMDEELDNEPVFYKGSFNVDKITLGAHLVGLELTLETDKPYAYGEERVEEWTTTYQSLSHRMVDGSDEVGYIYPKIQITCNASGNLTVSNDLTDTTMVINNCTSGEVITIDGENQIISTSRSSHKIYEDFNYEFLKIGNDFDNGVNTITVNLACKIRISYYPVMKYVT